MKAPKFRKPNEIKSKSQKVTVSTRIDVVSKDYLEKQAKKNGLSLSELLSHVVSDYVSWLKTGSK